MLRQPLPAPQPFSIKLASVLIALVIIVYGLHALAGLLIPLVFAILFSVLLFPLAHRFERWRFPRILASLVCLLLLLGFIVGLFYAVSAQISSFSEVIPKLTQRAQQYVDQLQTLASDRFHINQQQQTAQIQKYTKEALAQGGTVLRSTLLATTGALTNVFLVLLFTFFFLLYRDFFRSFFYKAFADTKRALIDTVFQSIYTVVKDYLAGLVLVILIIGSMMTAGLFLLGVDYAIFFGFLGACLVLIPYFGISLGSLLPAAYTLVTQARTIPSKRWPSSAFTWGCR